MVDFTPLSIFASRRGSEQRKETPRNQRTCRLFPRLGFPLWNPSSEAPPFQGTPKGGNPSFSTESLEARWSLFWGKGANHCVVCPSGHVLCSLLFSPWPPARAAAACPLWPSGLLGHVLGATTECGGFGFQGPKNRGPESQRLCDFSPARPATKPPPFRNTPADLWPHPPPRWAPRGRTKFQRKGRAELKVFCGCCQSVKGRKLGGLVVLGGVEYIPIRLRFFEN